MTPCDHFGATPLDSEVVLFVDGACAAAAHIVRQDALCELLNG